MYFALRIFKLFIVNADGRLTNCMMISLTAIRIITIRFFGQPVIFTVFCSNPFIFQKDTWTFFRFLRFASNIPTSWTGSFSDYHLFFIMPTENVLYTFSIIQIMHSIQPEISSALSSIIQFILWAFTLRRTLMLNFWYRYAAFWENSMDQNSMSVALEFEINYSYSEGFSFR